LDGSIAINSTLGGPMPQIQREINNCQLGVPSKEPITYCEWGASVSRWRIKVLTTRGAVRLVAKH
jgi:hypothetical protein